MPMVSSKPSAVARSKSRLNDFDHSLLKVKLRVTCVGCQVPCAIPFFNGINQLYRAIYLLSLRDVA